MLALLGGPHLCYDRVMTSKPATDEHLFLIDASGFVFRAYHALPALSTSMGQPTGAVLGFCNMLYKLLEDYQPTHLATVFDAGRSTFRRELYPDYKANRPAAPEDLTVQFQTIGDLLEAFQIPRLELRGYEADDLIATLVRRAQARELPVTIVSSDKDLMQLAGDGVQLLDTMKNKLYDAELVQAKYGVAPTALGDWLALVGDASDNVPGVPGVGPKTATKLLQEYGGLESVLGAAANISAKRLRENLLTHTEQARLSRKLVALQDDCPLEIGIEDLARKPPDQKQLWSQFDALEFGRLKEKVASGEQFDRDQYETVLDLEALNKVVRAIRDAGCVAVDVETTELDPMRASIVGISLCWGRGKACYVPTGHLYLGMPKQLPLDVVLETLAPVLCDASCVKYGQNHKYDWIVLRQAGVDVRGLGCDPMLASYVLDPSRNSHGLDELALQHLGHKMLAFKEVAGKERQFSSTEVADATRYAGEDAEVTFVLAEKLRDGVQADSDLDRLLREVELPLSAILARMERRGCGIDVYLLRQLSSELDGQLFRLEQDVQNQAGWPVNINSPKQLQKLLFEQMGLSTGRKTKTGYSTDSDVLADLAIEHPIAARIEEFRTLSKLKGTYLDAFPTLVNPKTGRIHTSYNQAVAATGRLSSSDPNLQNIPVRTDLGRRIREAFVAPAGQVLLSADYSQIELRILAHLSQDPLLLDAFAREQDVHQRTAAEVFGVAPEHVSDEQRRVAKAVNFGVIYGQTDWGLSRQLRIPKHQAKSYIDGYFERYAGVKIFMDRIIEEARETRYVHTMLGRRRPVGDINARRWANRMYAERIVRNTPIQGTAADLMKMAMIRVDAAISRAGLPVQMILTVHDELVFEVPPEHVAPLSELVVAEMASVAQLDVALKVDTGIGSNWAAAH